MIPEQLELTLGLPDDAAQSLNELVRDKAASRLFAADDSLWGDAAQPEASVRLGWVNPAGESGATEHLIASIESLRDELNASGIDRIVLSGMGGSSLAPEVITRRYGVPLVILDSTHPARVRAALGADLSRTALVVSSKSGSTVETRSHRASFEAAFSAQGIDPSGRIIVVTDPGSPFETSARERGNRIFLADSNVGGRYSALTAFGLVPSGLAGADIRELLSEAVSCHSLLALDSEQNPALRLAASIFAGLPDRFALVLAPGAGPQDAERDSHTDWGLPDWIEQLVAESTGKLGLGVLPVAVHTSAPETSGHLPRSARLLAISRLSEPADGDRLVGPLGAQLLCWEAATALLGRLMGINPFDQPDVESAKNATRELLGHDAPDAKVLGSLSDIAGSAILRAPADLPVTNSTGLWQGIFSQLPTNGYLSIQAYLDSGSQLVLDLHELRERLAAHLSVPVTLGWGPRFLHSTGQLHKGGPAVGVFLQLTDEVLEDLSIPGSPQSYHELLTAQAAGDARVLADRGRPVSTLRFNDPRAGVRALRVALDALSEATR